MAPIYLVEVRQRIEAAASRSDRDPAGIRLVVVTKSASQEGIEAVYGQGHRDFGENRADRFAQMAAALPDDVRWHFIGRLQGNKVRRVRPLAHLLHSLDRAKLAGYWLKGPGRPPPVLIQVNIGREPQKGGVLPEDAGSLVETAEGMGLHVMGLMAIPPQVDRPELARPRFSELRELRDRLAAGRPELTELSMGMTDDFEAAVEEGATILRVGRAIFDPSDH